MSVTTSADVHPAGHLRAVSAAPLLACTPRTGGQAAVQSQHSTTAGGMGLTSMEQKIASRNMLALRLRLPREGGPLRSLAGMPDPNLMWAGHRGGWRS